MATTDDLTLRMKAQGARQTARDVDRASGSVRRMGKQSNVALRGVTRLGSGLRLVAGGAAALGVAFGATALMLGKKAIGEFRESQKVGNQTAAVLKSMGATAWTSSKQIGDLANSISVKSGIDDEAIQSASNLLLTFGKVRNETGKNNDIFNRATQAAVDLSAAGFGSMDSTAKQLGKALNDPVKGITALNKSGVTFTKKQKDTIKGLVAQNKTLDAQKIIMREVERQVKGSAAAQADPIDKLTVAWNNMLEVAGGPLWSVVTAGINRVIGPLQHVSNVASDVFADKNLNWKQRFQIIGQSIRHWFGPIATEIKAALVSAFRSASGAAAHAFITGFKNAPGWVHLLTAGFLVAKLRGVWGSLASSGCSSFSSAFNPCVGGKVVASAERGALAASFSTMGALLGPLAGALIAAAIIDELSSKEPGKRAESANPEGVRAHHKIKPGEGPTGAQIYSARTHDPLPANDEAYKGYRGIPQPGPIHVHTHIDGKEVAHTVARHGTKKKATR